MTTGTAPDDAKQRTAALFDRASATYEDVDVEFFGRWGRRLVELSGIGAGDRVLDVGCGSGAVLGPAAEAVQPGGRVTAIDLAPGMVRRCTELSRSNGWHHVEVHEGDAEAPPLEDGSVDAVLAGLLIFFLPDPDAALDAYHRALVPGGRLAFSTFGEEDPRFRAVFGAIAAHSPAPPPRTAPGDEDDEPRIGQGPFQTPEGIEAILARHGFEQVGITTEANEVRFEDPEHWIRWSWSHGARAVWESVPGERREAAHADAVTALGALADPTGAVVQRWTLRYTTAVRG
jgi:ubiquinone/menaquinone biosynthesis C-methylase UbiE